MVHQVGDSTRSYTIKPTYSFHSAPRTPWDKSACRDDTRLPYGNIMFDRRVVRGPAFVHHPIPTVGVESQAAREAEARRRSMARRKAQKAKILKLRVGTPPPPEGRQHEPVQTELYLEEVFDHPVELVAETQTDVFQDRPQTPPYIPAKTGVDISTQIYQGELFDFNTEVKPLLEVLVGKTLEQALVEVMEEEELEAIKEQQRQFREKRDAEKAEEQRLEEQELRRRLEMEERLQEQEDAVEAQAEASERVAAAVLTTGYLEGLLPSVLDGLRDSGQALDPDSSDIEENFMPWLTDCIQEEIRKTIETEDFISDLVGKLLRLRAETFSEVNENPPPETEEAEEEPPSEEPPAEEAPETEEQPEEQPEEPPEEQPDEDQPAVRDQEEEAEDG